MPASKETTRRFARRENDRFTLLQGGVADERHQSRMVAHGGVYSGGRGIRKKVFFWNREWEDRCVHVRRLSPERASYFLRETNACVLRK